MSIFLRKFSYRFAEQVINSKLAIKNELEQIIIDSCSDLSCLSRPVFNEILAKEFSKHNWISQPVIFPDDVSADARFDFLKDRVGVEVQFGHASFIGIDLLKFQIASYSNYDNIDIGVYVVTTKRMQKHLIDNYSLKWEGSLTFEKVINYLPHIRSAIQVPIYVLGIDI